MWLRSSKQSVGTDRVASRHLYSRPCTCRPLLELFSSGAFTRSACGERAGRDQLASRTEKVHRRAPLVTP